MEKDIFGQAFALLSEHRAGIRFARQLEHADPDMLWIDDEQHIRQILSSSTDISRLNLVCAGAASDLPSIADAKNAVLLMVDTDLMTLYSRMSEKLTQYWDWERALLSAGLSMTPIQSVVDAAAEKLEATVVLLDSELHAIYFGGIGNCEYAPLNSAMAFDHSPVLKDMQFNDAGICSSVTDGWLCRRQAYDGKLVRQILIFFRDTSDPCDIDTMVSMLCDRFAGILKSGRAASKKYISLAKIFAEIIDGTLGDECEIDQMLSQTESPPKQFCSFGIVDFSHERVINSARISLAHQLSEIFPGSSFTVYNNLLVVLISDDSRKNQPYPYVDYEKLNALLENCDAYIALSNATSRRSMLRTNFLLACSTLHIGRALSQNPHQRTFFYEEYVEYITIDLCANSFRETMGHDDIVFLTHPSVVRVYRYDKVHNTDLLNVLYCYCIKNCNVSLAAEAAFMHRNTFTSRLAKLRKIFTEDLNSGEVQHRVIFSYKVLQYYEKICNVKLIERFLPSPPV